MSERDPIEGLSIHQIPSGAVFTWCNRKIPINRLMMSAYILGWLLAMPLGIFLTASLVRDILRWQQGLPAGTTALGISALFLILNWGIIWYLSFTILRWTWHETLTVDENGVRILFAGPLAPGETLIPKDDIWQISFEKFRTRREQEAIHTLNVFHGESRETLAFWMAKPEKEKLYNLLRSAIEAQGWPYVQFRTGEG